MTASGEDAGRRLPAADELLRLLAGFTQQHLASSLGSALRPNRSAVVDPAYSSASYPGTLPKVTFDGEDVMSTRTYAAVSPYVPSGGDRVAMIPLGNSYVIVGKLPS